MADFQKIILEKQTDNKSVGLTVSKGTIDDSTLNRAVLNKASVKTQEYGSLSLEETFDAVAKKIKDIQFLVDSGDTLTSIAEVVAAYEKADGNLKETINVLTKGVASDISKLRDDVTTSLEKESGLRSGADTLLNWRLNFQPKVVLNSSVDAQALIDGVVSTSKFIGDAQLFLNGVFFAAPAFSTDAEGYTTSVSLPPTAESGMTVVVYGLAVVSNTFYPELPE